MNKTLRCISLILAMLLLFGGLIGCDSEEYELGDTSYFSENETYEEESAEEEKQDEIFEEKIEIPEFEVDYELDQDLDYEPIFEETPSEEMVWIPKTGSKYHNRSSCSNMKNPSQVTKSQAISWGYEPCKKCY